MFVQHEGTSYLIKFKITITIIAPTAIKPPISHLLSSIAFLWTVC
nr:MAG TPA: hypothetical protein [Caudoviricetes sp.]